MATFVLIYSPYSHFFKNKILQLISNNVSYTSCFQIFFNLTATFIYSGQTIHYLIRCHSQVALVVKNLPANAGDLRDAGLIRGSGRSPGGECDNPLQYSCLENPHGQGSLVGYSLWGRRVRHNWSDLAAHTKYN